ncbi:type VI secretion system protein TssA [Alloacidobacterium dinghuense]|uniref:Type VI secretion system protein TssA n=1 Tax=Alloacidobacterium dinghuense TaxID=2763107 RepID=A0A7G8BMM8_9BACT|nr:type VI secretion system protein TssA [Alloacidobacterium dinghuense]QNI33798.1 type VI secretion system protein TssA [Alloacidobacterium dinghuense]
MPLRDDLLNPIPGDNPSGASLRYDKIYDQIKEARTEDDDSLPSGAWERTVKKADFNLVIKLAGEALSTKSKDLQLAAWLTEAHVKKEGLSLVEPCFKLIHDLQEQFWDTIYPLIEDDDVGLRAMPIEWAANRVAALVREAPITKKGLNFFQYKESRTVGYEGDAESSDSKREARRQAIEDGKTTGEDFDAAFAATSKAFYVGLHDSLQSTLTTLETLQSFSEEKYRDEGPSFAKLRTSIQEVDQVVNSLLAEKRKLEPDPVDEAAVEGHEEMSETEESAGALVAVHAGRGKSLSSLAMRNAGFVSAKPTDWSDAVNRIRECTLFIQEERPSSPATFLLQAVVQLGEMGEQDDLARDMIRQGQLPQAIQLLLRDAARQPNGRARFQSRLHIAQLCVDAGEKRVAVRVLDELIKEIDERKLEEWEAGELIAQPLALLLKCIESDDDGRREELFSRLCRIDPIAALNVSH